MVEKKEMDFCEVCPLRNRDFDSWSEGFIRRGIGRYAASILRSGEDPKLIDFCDSDTGLRLFEPARLAIIGCGEKIVNGECLDVIASQEVDAGNIV